ncbi:hypothetical protein BD414DRAFT_78717 [Trametes punicea]|nr:hypothetical protein BD414DRAFT_78717 [Trametes punicea]
MIRNWGRDIRSMGWSAFIKDSLARERRDFPDDLLRLLPQREPSVSLTDDNRASRLGEGDIDVNLSLQDVGHPLSWTPLSTSHLPRSTSEEPRASYDRVLQEDLSAFSSRSDLSVHAVSSQSSLSAHPSRSWSPPPSPSDSNPVQHSASACPPPLFEVEPSSPVGAHTELSYHRADHEFPRPLASSTPAHRSASPNLTASGSQQRSEPAFPGRLRCSAWPACSRFIISFHVGTLIHSNIVGSAWSFPPWELSVPAFQAFLAAAERPPATVCGCRDI